MPAKKTSKGKTSYSKYYDKIDRENARTGKTKTVKQARQQTKELRESIKRPIDTKKGARAENRRQLKKAGVIGSYVNKRNKALDFE
jgi:hypothetical protein